MPRRGFALNRWLLRESKSKRICITVIPYCFDRRSLPASSPSSFAPAPACVRGARCRAPAGAQTGIIKSVIISVKLMKKLLQLVALAAVGVLAFQPALFSVACHGDPGKRAQRSSLRHGDESDGDALPDAPSRFGHRLSAGLLPMRNGKEFCPVVRRRQTKGRQSSTFPAHADDGAGCDCPRCRRTARHSYCLLPAPVHTVPGLSDLDRS